jgi:trypsin-like peptidase
MLSNSGQRRKITFGKHGDLGRRRKQAANFLLASTAVLHSFGAGGDRIMAQGFLLLLIFGQLADSDDFPKAMQERALAATVRIVNRSRQIEGSGVLIGRKGKSSYILTAAHFLGRGDRLEIATFTVNSYPEAEKVYSKADLVAHTKDTRDLALVRLTADDPPRGVLTLCPLDLLPKDREFGALSVGCAGGIAPICIVEKVKGAKEIRRRTKMRPALFWEAEDEQTSGRSGGPLIDRRGRVIGVASGASDGKGYYSHAEEIHRWLKATDFDFLIEEKEPQKRGR